MSMNNPSELSFASIVITTFITSLVISLFYITYVLPGDVIKMKISTCMGDDLSRDSYEQCVRFVELCSELEQLEGEARGHPDISCNL